MPRKGIKRVKTGCNTCKIRKVKCDETRPSCFKCTQTGRKCDGYAPPVLGPSSWSRLLDPSLALRTRARPEAELRALAFFQRVAAPTLARPLDGYFWTHIVLQLADHEPAAKHAVLAISALYEGLNHSRHPGKKRWKEEEQQPPPADAIFHYNKAVACMQTAQDRNLVLAMCLIFVCIEFLRGNHPDAVRHCSHGINMLNEPHAQSDLVRQYVEPAFCRLSVFPYFFGATPDTFPRRETAGPISLYLAAVSEEPFRSVVDAHTALNPLMVQTVRLMRSAGEYRLGMTTSSREPDADKVERARLITDALDQWYNLFQTYKHLHAAAETFSTSGMVQLVEMQYLVCKVYAATCLSREETAYDAHMNKFSAIVDLARQAVASSPALEGGTLTMEMGFTPLLTFVVIKCRCLPLRLSALELMQSVSLPRESGWDYDALYAMGRRTIEVEHGFELGEHARWDDFAEHEAVLPPDEDRIRDSVMDPEPIFDGQVSEEDQRLLHKVTFLMKGDAVEGFKTRDEWLTFGRA